MGTLGKTWKNSPETVEKRVTSRRKGAGFSPSVETREKISKTLTGRKVYRKSRFASDEERKINKLRTQKEWSSRHPDRIRAAQVKSLYNLSEQDHQLLLEKQQFHCGIAACPASVDKRSPVDHDHRCCPGKKSCGKCVRGILCTRHNVGLAHFQDNCEELVAAAKYLTDRQL